MQLQVFSVKLLNDVSCRTRASQQLLEQQQRICVFSGTSVKSDYLHTQAGTASALLFF
jgi:hypothetical protein